MRWSISETPTHKPRSLIARQWALPSLLQTENSHLSTTLIARSLGTRSMKCYPKIGRKLRILMISKLTGLRRLIWPQTRHQVAIRWSRDTCARTLALCGLKSTSRQTETAEEVSQVTSFSLSHYHQQEGTSWSQRAAESLCALALAGLILFVIIRESLYSCLLLWEDSSKSSTEAFLNWQKHSFHHGTNNKAGGQ